MSSYQRSTAPPYYLPQTLQLPHISQAYQQQRRHTRRSASRAQEHSNHDWVYMSDDVSNDIRAMTQDMRNRRLQWQKEREQRQEEIREAERRRVETTECIMEVEEIGE